MKNVYFFRSTNETGQTFFTADIMKDAELAKSIPGFLGSYDALAAAYKALHGEDCGGVWALLYHVAARAAERANVDRRNLVANDETWVVWF